MDKGVTIKLTPLDDDHVRARIAWREQDIGGGTLVVEVTVRNMKTAPKSRKALEDDARAIAARFTRAFADTIEH